MEDTFKIISLGIEFSQDPLIVAGRELLRMNYCDAIKMNLIKGNKDGWRIPSIKEMKFFDDLTTLEIVDLPQYYYLTSEAGPSYISREERENNPEIQNAMEEDPFYLSESGISDTYIWDSQMHDAWGGQYDENSYHYILIRNI
jgi:hypothetical protein